MDFYWSKYAKSRTKHGHEIDFYWSDFTDLRVVAKHYFLQQVSNIEAFYDEWVFFCLFLKKIKMLLRMGMEHFKDKTGLLPKNLNHGDQERRKSYLDRSGKIKDKQGRLTKDLPSSANYHARRVLWNA